MEQPETAPRFETRLRVRYAETDQMRVVYYANYYVWMEIARVEFVRSRGLSYRDLEVQEGLFLAVIESQCRYLSPARYDQEIVLETYIANGNPRVIEFQYEIKDAQSRLLLAAGMTKHMWLDREWRPTRLPPQYRQVLGIE